MTAPKDGWIPIWTDGKGWQLWRNDDYVATVSLCTARGRSAGWVYLPRHSKHCRKFKNFQSAADYVKAFDL
jgi:hypothetical protein